MVLSVEVTVKAGSAGRVVLANLTSVNNIVAVLASSIPHQIVLFAGLAPRPVGPRPAGEAVGQRGTAGDAAVVYIGVILSVLAGDAARCAAEALGAGGGAGLAVARGEAEELLIDALFVYFYALLGAGNVFAHQHDGAVWSLPVEVFAVICYKKDVFSCELIAIHPIHVPGIRMHYADVVRPDHDFRAVVANRTALDGLVRKIVTVNFVLKRFCIVPSQKVQIIVQPKSQTKNHVFGQPQHRNAVLLSINVHRDTVFCGQVVPRDNQIVGVGSPGNIGYLCIR